MSLSRTKKRGGDICGCARYLNPPSLLAPALPNKLEGREKNKKGLEEKREIEKTFSQNILCKKKGHTTIWGARKKSF